MRRLLDNWVVALFVVTLAAGGFGIFKAVRWACHSEYRQGKVIKLEWRHRTNLRERRTYSDGDWGAPPRQAGYYREGTFNHDCYSKFSHKQCTSLEEVKVCVPVHRRWCDYRYHDWPTASFQEVSGEGHAVTWETFGPVLDEDHRETTEGWYVVEFTNTKETWRYPTRSKSTYDKFELGDLWELEFPNVGKMHPTKKTVLEAL
jgi:hypothetical protein